MPNVDTNQVYINKMMAKLKRIALKAMKGNTAGSLVQFSAENQRARVKTLYLGLKLEIVLLRKSNKLYSH